MQTVTLPRTDLKVSRLCFGCWGIVTDFHWGDRDPQQSIIALQQALDAGINFFDTAAVYGNGESEKLLGRVFRDRRDQVVIATKIRPDLMEPAQIVQSCEQSLQRLGTDYVDLLQTHWTSPDTPPAESWQALLDLQRQGKARYVGVSNMGVADLEQVSSVERPVTNQLPYNLLWRAIEARILPACRDTDVGVLVYSPLMHGLLADRYQAADEVPDGRARSRHFSSARRLVRHGETGCEAETFTAISAVREIARHLERSTADVALAWCAAQAGVHCVIAGASTPDQLAANIASLHGPLSEAAVDQLNEATEALRQQLGENPDMWQGRDGSRYR